MTEDAFDKLNDTKSSVGGGGDYADWWNNENFNVTEGDEIVGVVVEKHAYTDPGGEDHPVATVRSLGQDAGSHLDQGVEVSTPTRKGIEPFADDAKIGSLVLIEYTGQIPTNSGRDMHTYEASKLTREEWQGTSQEDLIRDVLDGEIDESAGGSSDTTESGVPEKAVEFATDTTKINDGELTVDELDEYLNEVRDYDVDPEEIAEAADDLTLEDDTVTHDE